jgi:hypothetical protein
MNNLITDEETNLCEGFATRVRSITIFGVFLFKTLKIGQSEFIVTGKFWIIVSFVLCVDIGIIVQVTVLFLFIESNIFPSDIKLLVSKLIA